MPISLNLFAQLLLHSTYGKCVFDDGNETVQVSKKDHPDKSPCSVSGPFLSQDEMEL